VELLGGQSQGRVLLHAPRDQVAQRLRALLRHPASIKTQRRLTLMGRVRPDPVLDLYLRPSKYGIPGVQRTHRYVLLSCVSLLLVRHVAMRSPQCRSHPGLRPLEQMASVIPNTASKQTYDVKPIELHLRARVWPRMGRSPVTISHRTTPEKKLTV